MQLCVIPLTPSVVSTTADKIRRFPLRSTSVTIRYDSAVRHGRVGSHVKRHDTHDEPATSTETTQSRASAQGTRNPPDSPSPAAPPTDMPKRMERHVTLCVSTGRPTCPDPDSSNPAARGVPTDIPKRMERHVTLCVSTGDPTCPDLPAPQRGATVRCWRPTARTPFQPRSAGRHSQFVSRLPCTDTPCIRITPRLLQQTSYPGLF